MWMCLNFRHFAILQLKILTLVLFMVMKSSSLEYTTTGLATRNVKIEESLRLIHDISTGAAGLLCVTKRYKYIPVQIDHTRWRYAQTRTDMAAAVLRRVGFKKKEFLEALAMSLNSYDNTHRKTVKLSRVAEIYDGRIVASSVAVWNGSEFLEPSLPTDNNLNIDNFPWFSSLINESESSQNISHHWTYPFYSCDLNSWIISNTRLENSTNGSVGIVSVDIDLSSLEVNQCNRETKRSDDEIFAFYGSHKCPEKSTKCAYRPRTAWSSASDAGWARGSYVCACLRGFYSATYPNGVNGSLIEVAFEDSLEKNLSDWIAVFECEKCQEGCETCSGPEPCLASYNWPFRITLLIISVSCAILTVFLAVYTRVHRRAKVFKVASPVFLSITLLGCTTMYMEMAAIFPVLDTYSCIATKWTRHMGFCITYTALLMKTWRVSLTYRVKSAHKLKLTDKQLLQWMAPVLLIMLVYLATWTLSATPYAEYITDENGLKFKQCSFNWWDHSLGIGEIIFLLWGVRVCYRVRHAESLYNEARQISFAIYNIAFINLTMLAFHIQIIPKASPDIKYLLGFIRIQLSTTTTILLVFAPKILRIIKGNEETWENVANGVGAVPEEPRDVYQENDELKEEIQKLASRIEFMKTVQMVLHNRHLKPKPGSYFSSTVNPRNNFHETSGPV